jgi:hypothetical protein
LANKTINKLTVMEMDWEGVDGAQAGELWYLFVQ